MFYPIRLTMINYKKSRRESNAFDFEFVSLNHSDRDMICFFPVTERSEDTGLVYSLSVVRRAERLKFTMKKRVQLQFQIKKATCYNYNTDLYREIEITSSFFESTNYFNLRQQIGFLLLYNSYRRWDWTILYLQIWFKLFSFSF